jgi:hypothetical protein
MRPFKRTVAACSDSGLLLLKRDVACIVQLVLNVPMAADRCAPPAKPLRLAIYAAGRCRSNSAPSHHQVRFARLAADDGTTRRRCYRLYWESREW